MSELAELHGHEVTKDALDNSIRDALCMHQVVERFGPPLSDIRQLTPEKIAVLVAEADLQGAVARCAYQTAADRIRKIMEGDLRPIRPWPKESEQERASRIWQMCQGAIERGFPKNASAKASKEKKRSRPTEAA